MVKKHPDSHIRTIDLGDFEDMPSLSSWDFGKMAFEGRRYIDDINVAKWHRQLVYEPVQKYIEHRKNNKKKTPLVSHWALGGNHLEGRINKYIQQHREVEGLISLDPYIHFLGELGVQYQPYQLPLELDGINYVHYWENRGNQKPIGVGMYPAQAIIRHKHASSVVGHSHVLDRATAFAGNGNRIFSLVAGCFLDPDEREDYAGQANDQWWKGIVVLHGVEGGFPYGGEEYIPIERLLHDYL
jgi:hypothetical protein